MYTLQLHVYNGRVPVSLSPLVHLRATVQICVGGRYPHAMIEEYQEAFVVCRILGHTMKLVSVAVGMMYLT